MSALSPAAALSAQLDAEWTEGKHLAVATDAHSYPDRVLVAIRRAAVSCVMAIQAKDYDGMFLVRLLGFNEAKPDPMAAAIEAKAKTHDRVRKS